jgi:H/ACA ribonucleoprotein complex subunit 3
MPTHIMRCSHCRTYTLESEKCKKCGHTLENVYPPKFSIEDKYQKYRIDFFRQKMDKKVEHEKSH